MAAKAIFLLSYQKSSSKLGFSKTKNPGDKYSALFLLGWTRFYLTRNLSISSLFYNFSSTETILYNKFCKTSKSIPLAAIILHWYIYTFKAAIEMSHNTGTSIVSQLTPNIPHLGVGSATPCHKVLKITPTTCAKTLLTTLSCLKVVMGGREICSTLPESK